MFRIVAVAFALALAGCQLPHHRPCPTGFELRFDSGQYQDSVFGWQGSRAAGVTVYYDLTGECDAFEE